MCPAAPEIVLVVKACAADRWVDVDVVVLVVRHILESKCVGNAKLCNVVGFGGGGCVCCTE
jgi:hypothetical protein